MILKRHTQLIYRSILDGRIVFIQGDHFVAQKNPKAFNREVLRFLRFAQKP